jgi:radical SAM protein with 4Fe4S-binding SPASM domain
MKNSSTDVIRLGLDQAEGKLERLLGADYLNYRDRWKNASRDIPDMIHLDVELVDSCNQSCIMCPRNRDTHQKLDYELGTRRRLEYSVYRRVIQELSGIGLVSVNFGGFAEPFIHKDWVRFVEAAHEIGMVDTRLITNGLLLENNYQRILDSNLRNLYVSIDADSQSTYERIRGAGFKKILSSLDRFLTLRKEQERETPVVRVSFVVLEENEAEVDAFINRWLPLVDHLDIQRKFDYTSREIGPAKLWSCDHPWKRMSLLANGDIIPCCSFNGRSLVLGNAYSSSASEIWSSVQMSQLRIDLKDDKIRTCNICQSQVV